MAKKFFRLLTGSHSEPGGVAEGGGENYTAGENDIVESEYDLIAMFPNKFERTEKPVTKKVATKEVLPEDEETAEPTVVEEGPGTEFGTEVTDQFSAGPMGLRVFRNEAGFVVVDAENPTVALNETPLRTNKEVKKFCEKNATK